MTTIIMKRWDPVSRRTETEQGALPPAVTQPMLSAISALGSMNGTYPGPVQPEALKVELEIKANGDIVKNFTWKNDDVRATAEVSLDAKTGTSKVYLELIHADPAIPDEASPPISLGCGLNN